MSVALLQPFARNIHMIGQKKNKPTLHYDDDVSSAIQLTSNTKRLEETSRDPSHRTVHFIRRSSLM